MGLRGPGCSPGQPRIPFCDMGEAVGECCLQGLLRARPSLCRALVTGRLILSEGPADRGHKGAGCPEPPGWAEEASLEAGPKRCRAGWHTVTFFPSEKKQRCPQWTCQAQSHCFVFLHPIRWWSQPC